MFCVTQVRKSKKFVLRIRIKHIAEKLDVKNIFDLVDKEIKGKFETDYNKLEILKDMDQNLLKMKNLCMHMNEL